MFINLLVWICFIILNPNLQINIFLNIFSIYFYRLHETKTITKNIYLLISFLMFKNIYIF